MREREEKESACDESETTSSRQASKQQASQQTPTTQITHAHTGRGGRGKTRSPLLLRSCLIKATAGRRARQAHATRTRAEQALRCSQVRKWRPEDLFLGGGGLMGRALGGWRGWKKERFARLLLQGHAHFYSSDLMLSIPSNMLWDLRLGRHREGQPVLAVALPVRRLSPASARAWPSLATVHVTSYRHTCVPMG